VSAGGGAAASTIAPRRDFGAACVVMGVSFVAQNMLALAVPLYALQLGAAVATIRLLVSLPFWLPPLVAVPIGHVVSRMGARRTMLVGAVGMTLAPWCTVLAPSVFVFVGRQLLLGVTEVTTGWPRSRRSPRPAGVTRSSVSPAGTRRPSRAASCSGR
jgi:MFS family permease